MRIPLAEVDEARFVALYDEGLTTSAPDLAYEMVFGSPPSDELMTKLTSILPKSQRDEGRNR